MVNGLFELNKIEFLETIIVFGGDLGDVADGLYLPDLVAKRRGKPSVVTGTGGLHRHNYCAAQDGCQHHQSLLKEFHSFKFYFVFFIMSV